jgi:hypothetical protein
MPSLEIPRETDEYVGPLLAIDWDGEATTDYDVGVTPVNTRPDGTFTAYPGPKVPTSTGRYLVQARKSGIVRDIGELVVT